jgi:hypothetical protein
MATVESKKPSKKLDAQSAAPAKQAKVQPKRRRRFRLIFWMPLLLFFLLLGLAPALVSWTPLGPWLVNRFAPINGSVEIGSLSVGWFSPVSASDITLRDAQADTVVEVASASGDKTLVQLILNHSDLGHFDIEGPKLNLVLRDNGSNLEDVLAPLLNGGSENSAPPSVSVAVKIADGSATIDDQTGGHKYQINSVAADAAWDSSGQQPLTAEGSVKLVDANRTAAVTFSLTTQNDADAAGTLAGGHVTCQIGQLPLDVVEPILRRRVAGAQLAGSLSANLDCSWGGGSQHDEVSVQGQIDATDLLLTAAALGRDRIEMAKLSVPCQIVGTSKELRIDKLLVDCDLGQVSLTGKIALADFAAGNVLTAVAHEACQLTGKLDLVRLAALLPDTLRIRPGTQVTAGELGISLTSQPAAADQAPGMSWSGKIETSDLEAVADGAQFKWQQPLSVEFQAHDSPSGPVVDKLNCDSSFLHVQGSGTLDQLVAGASFDLNQLATELAQFVDLGGCQLAGTGQLQLTWQRDQNGHVQSQADISASNFALATPGRRPWQEASVTLHVEGAGTMSDTSLQHVDTFAARLDAGQEHLTAQLAGPLDNPLAAAWPVQIGWQGELADLLPRVELWIGATSATAGWDLSGSCSLAATAQVSADSLDVEQCKLSIQRLHLWGHGLHLDEPQAELTGTAAWQRASGKIDLPLVSLKGTAIIARLNNFALVSTANSGPQASGNATLQGDLATLARWLQDPLVPPSRRIAGQLSGQAEIALGDGASQATLNAVIDQLQVVEVPAPALPQSATLLGPAAAPKAPLSWQEPRLTLAARIDYDAAHDQMRITQGELAGKNLQAQINGNISGIESQPNLDLTGQIVCDWEQLAPLWKPFVGDAVQIVGHEPWPFTLRGPWTSGATPVLAGAQRMTGGATVRWLSASAYGLDIGSGTLDARLADGTLTLQPVNVAVAGGQIMLAPMLRLAATPAEIDLPAGPMLTNVKLSQEVCAHALKFVAPVFAEVTRTEGQFSVTLQGGRLPLADPTSGDVAGQLLVQSVEMRPGPILQTLVGFAEQVEGILQGKVPFANPAKAVALVRMDNQSVDFRMVDHRVYHQGLKFVAGNVTITTRGSVGLDESIAVLAEIPLPQGLLKQNNPEAQTLKIPITGTLKNPKMDPKAIEQLPLLLIKGTGSIINRVEGALEKLVPGDR